ncbi:MAG: C25 family cysteine peptidase, partial [Prevotellaceae bacterium]|nr:C25 family cysteine peptidase [Prevotellaceae bacterium]
MTRLTMILVAILLAFTVNAQNIILPTNGSKGITKSNDRFSGFQATFSYSQIESVTITGTEKGSFSAITIAGAYLDGDFGMPGLPIFRKMISVPVGATPKIVIRNYTAAEYRLEDYGIQTIFPVQPDVRKDQSNVPFIYDEKAYTLNDYNYSDMAEVGVLGKMRGMVIGMLVVRPVQYNPVTNTIMVYNDIEVEVTFEDSDVQKTHELFTKTYSPHFANMYGVAFNQGVHKGVFEDNPDLHTTPVRMLVIANRMFEATLQPWIEWKTKKGFYMDVNYTDVIGTTAAAIKTFCHNKYNSGIGSGTAPTYIVIVGDTPQVPASQTGSSTAKATDLYYATVDSDYFPEMYYSRMSATTTAQLENIIEKILYYEQYQFADPSFLDNVLLIAGADGTWNPRVGQPAINYAANYYYNAANGYANVYKYLDSYSGCYANFNNVGFANYTAHCSETSWGDPSFTNSQIGGLTNLNKYFVAMGNCCLAADFGYGECFGEAMIRAEKKGAVGYIGSSPSSYWGDDFHFAVGAYAGNIETITNPTLQNTTDGVYDLMFRDADFNCLSSHVFGGNLAVTYAHVNPGYTVHTSSPWYYWEAYNVLGDGSLMPYNGQAVDNTVSHLPIVPIGMTSYEITAIPGSYAAISKDGILHGVAVADASGIANVSLDPPIISGGDVDIVVTRNQYRPYIVQIPAAALSGPYIVSNGYDVADGSELTYISGNSQIAVTLKNVGADPTAGTLSVNISCDDPQLTINSATATCGSMNDGGTAIVNFNVTVANSIPDNKTFPVTVTVTDTDNTVWESILSLKAYAPDFSLEQVLVNGVEDGNLEPDAITTLTLVIKNKGNADAFAVIGDITTSSAFITPACDDQNTVAQNLPAGETIELTFIVITDQSMPFGHNADFNLSLTAQYGRTYEAPFNAVCSAGSFCIPQSSNGCNSNDKFTLVKLTKVSNGDILIDHAPTCNSPNGYTNYTGSIIVPIEPGAQYVLNVTVGNGGTQHIKGWFDVNGNNIFDANELLFSGSCSSGGSTSFTFTAPQDYMPGNQCFRLRCQYNTAPADACSSMSYGQTLDYTIVLPEIYPRVQNVVAVLDDSNITINWDAPNGQTPDGYNIYRNGNRLNTTLLTSPTFTESNLSDGVYVYNVTAVFAGNQESLAQMSNIICLTDQLLFTINYNTPANGTLSVTAGTATIENGTLVNANTVLTITATPDDAVKYRLETLTVNETNFTSGN